VLNLLDVLFCLPDNKQWHNPQLPGIHRLLMNHGKTGSREFYELAHQLIAAQLISVMSCHELS
jgi:hypothetical protein